MFLHNAFAEVWKGVYIKAFICMLETHMEEYLGRTDHAMDRTQGDFGPNYNIFVALSLNK